MSLVANTEMSDSSDVMKSVNSRPTCTHMSKLATHIYIHYVYMHVHTYISIGRYALGADSSVISGMVRHVSARMVWHRREGGSFIQYGRIVRVLS